MAKNYVLLETVTVGAAGAASVTFNNIPQSGYTDLVVKFSARGDTTGGGGVSFRFNGATTGYSERLLYGTGTSALSANTSSQTALVWGLSDASGSTANTFSNGELYVPNYTSSNYKSVAIDSVDENNATAANIYMDAGLWSNTAAITSITVLVSLDMLTLPS